MRERASQDKTMTAPERMAQMQAAMKDRAASMESVNESFKRLYAALSPEQKAAADKQFGAPWARRATKDMAAPVVAVLVVPAAARISARAERSQVD
jgi:hypothetical protein